MKNKMLNNKLKLMINKLNQNNIKLIWFNQN